MKSVLIAIFFVSQISNFSWAQTSQAEWDRRFHPEKYQQDRNAFYKQWFESWQHRGFTLEDVKVFLLSKPRPEVNMLDSNYHKIMDEDGLSRQAIRNGQMDYQLQDLAFLINVGYQKSLGNNEAAAKFEEQMLIARQRHAQRVEQEAAQQAQAINQAKLREQIDRLKTDRFLLEMNYFEIRLTRRCS